MKWQDISTAPKTSGVIRIAGRTFPNGRRYTAWATWATRRCPAECTDWFPPEPKTGGPFLDVYSWAPEAVYQQPEKS